MAPRRSNRKTFPNPDQQAVAEQPIAEDTTFGIDPSITADLLIKEELELDDYLSKQAKAFGEFCKPHKDRIETIRKRLLQMHLEQKTDSFKTEFGTSYVSEIMTQKIADTAPAYIDMDGKEWRGREAVLYWALDHWDAYGNEALSVAIPIKTIRQVMDDTKGHPPPGILVDYFKRVNINRG